MFWQIYVSLALATEQLALNTPIKSSGEHNSCPIDSPWSCSVQSGDSCCYEGTNGLFLQTQFWDYAPASGPADQWTIHGLWCDKCSGGFNQFCNPKWFIKDAKSTLLGLGLDDLVAQLSTIWKNQYKSDNDLWTHEFNKHGTCMSTVDPKCYPGNLPNENVGDFFKSAVRVYESLPTYKWLANEGILPSNDKTWSVAEFSSKIAKYTDGKTVYLGCDRKNNLNEVWYYMYLRGSVADGQFNLTDSITTSSCTDGFKYLPKSSHNEPGRGGSKRQIKVMDGDNELGCLISDGSWYASGTCGTYTLTETMGGVHLSSSKGPCGLSNGGLVCNSRINPTDFELSNDSISYGGSKVWGASSRPSKFNRVKVSPGGNAISFELKAV